MGAVVVLAQLSTNITANLFASAYAANAIGAPRVSFRWGAVITGALGLLTFPWLLLELFLTYLPAVGAALSALADAAAGAALDRALEEAERTGMRLAVVALGKWGGNELNYASDIDVIFVHHGDAEAAVAVAARFIDLLSARAPEGIAFRVDAGLRPEGAAGPLTRTVRSYRAYWERWAETWELQAMLKARFAAGDADLGRSLVDAANPFVFPETLGADAVRQIRATKRRVEEAAPGDDELKRGVGGIRDVEFAVQLLQLVHGRSDPALRSANTLEALGLLAEGGYVRAEDAADLAEAYRWLRDVEHRLQLFDLRQTHAVPTDSAGRERVAKALGYRDSPQGSAREAFEADLVDRRSRVRTIYERVFYRPLLEAFAESPAAAPARVERQLAAFGFADSEATRAAVTDLTSGLSRRSRLMQQMLPLMMGWLSEAPDPDLGLAQLRRLAAVGSEGDGLVAALRDDPASGERLCRLLGTSRLVGRLAERLPTAPLRLGDDQALSRAPPREALVSEAVGRLVGRTDPEARAESLHRFYAEQLLEIGAADLAGMADDVDVGRRLADCSDALVEAALQAAVEEVSATGRPVPPTAVVGLGKWGGGELNYASDLDLLVVFRGGDEEHADSAGRVAEELAATLRRSSLDLPSLEVDFDLRPEGTKGPLARSLEGYLTYWERWALTWEFQALLRARPVAGDPELGAEFVAAAAVHAFPETLDDDRVRQVRAMKARIERERIPVSEDPDFHVKLGRGGMADVEWTVQLLQMGHGRDHPGVRIPSTLAALEALAGLGLIDTGDAAVLDEAYRFCARVRNRLFHQAGRTRDSLPVDPEQAGRLARSLGYEVHPRLALREEYRRVTRRARRVVERVFYRG